MTIKPSNVVSLETTKPHVMVNAEAVHVVPLEFFRDLVRGAVTIDDLDCRDEILRVVIAEWLVYMGVRV